MMPKHELILENPVLLEVVVLINFLLFILIIALFITLLVHKSYVERRARRLDKLKLDYTNLLTKKYHNPAIEIATPVSPLEYEALGIVLSTLLTETSGELQASLMRFAQELGVDAYYRRMLDSRSWVKRFVAIEKLGFLRLPDYKPAYKKILREEENPHVLAKAVWALSLVSGRDDIQEINTVLRHPNFMSSKFNEYIYANIIRSFRLRDDEQGFLSIFKQMVNDSEFPLILKRDIVQACGDELLHDAQDIIIDCFNRFTDAAEMKIACIRALERLSAKDAQLIFASCLKDDDWRIRGAAAKNAYQFPGDFVEPLRKALYDPSYHVRVNAALSLSKIGDSGIEVLSEETRSDDRFVRDVVQYVLKRMIYAP